MRRRKSIEARVARDSKISLDIVLVLSRISKQNQNKIFNELSRQLINYQDEIVMIIDLVEILGFKKKLS